MKKILTLIVILTGTMMLGGCNNTAKTVQTGDTVEITYTASLDDGTVFKTTE
ncbi:hypothetical protein KKG31_03340 [Patescibacteria group bacterium]|nr:hypothetical protein [Patescibacteria group bacterium]MBU1758182.1 hypothetical protein [Patescibacteria group bacterium]